MSVDSFVHSCVLGLVSFVTTVELCVIPLGSYDAVLGMDWLNACATKIDYRCKRVQCVDDFGVNVELIGIQKPISLHMISVIQLKRCMQHKCQLFFVTVDDLDVTLDSHPLCGIMLMFFV